MSNEIKAVRQSASADGMKWDLYPQTLMSEYHIRYGGIGYYLWYLTTTSPS